MNIIFVALIIWIQAAPSSDLVTNIPGYKDGDTTKVYSGQLSTLNSTRKLHYVFIETQQQLNQSEPIVLWLNGGPGCSSMIGFLEEIGPYYLEPNSPYSSGNKLLENKNSWNKYTHLLFLDSPAGVGLSANDDPSYEYNDENTAEDALAALEYFFKQKFHEYRANSFYISGQSYAGKYIPDLAVKILQYNKKKKDIINLQGIMIGNGVMDLSNQILKKVQIEYILSHNFIDPKLIQSWENSCKKDQKSAGCQYFYQKYQYMVDRLNPKQVYGKCFDVSSEEGFLRKIVNGRTNVQEITRQCTSYDGVQSYFKINHQAFHSNKTDFKACDKKILEKYKVTPSGSMEQLAKLIVESNITLMLYSGNLDSTIPFDYTISNIQRLLMKQYGQMQPWKNGDQHAGFFRQFRYGDRQLQFYTVNGAGHQAPSDQRQRVLILLKEFLADEDDDFQDEL